MQTVPVRESTSDLVKDAVDDARKLVRLEVALAREEFRAELKRMKAAAIVFGIAAALAIAALAVLLVTLGVAIALSAIPVLVIGLITLGVAIAAAIAGWAAVPKKPMQPTRERIMTDYHLLKERIA